MQQKRHLLYVSGIVPRQSFGGSIILYRHLKLLEGSNWRISVISSQQSIAKEKFPEPWQVITMPDRRWWWPPVRPEIPGSLELRLRLWQYECNHLFRKERPSAILTVLWDSYSLFAALLSRAWQIPLSVIVHDDWELRASSESHRRLVRQYQKIVMEQATRVWPVSSKLGSTINLKSPGKMSVLLPIPNGKRDSFIEWSDKFKFHPVITYAGNLYPSFTPVLKVVAKALEQVNGTLLLVTNPNNSHLSELVNSSPNIKCHEPFEDNTEVIEFLSNNSSCILVGYPFDSTENLKLIGSFPSKLLEFSHVGVPLFILTPPNTALSDWAADHEWLCYLTSLDKQKLLLLLKQLTDKEAWTKMAKQSRQVALNEFNPSLIQKQFESELAVVNRGEG
jgi:glycosyltransferase involved in cell wall biosynthesis